MVIPDYSRANWKNFRNEIENKVKLGTHVNTRSELENMIKNLNSIINTAVKNNIPVRKEGKIHSSIKIRKLIKVKNHYRRKWQKSRDLKFKNIMLIFQRLINSLLYEIENSRIRVRLQKARVSDNSLWALTGNLKKRRVNLPPLIHGNEMAFKDSDKVDALVNYYASVHDRNVNLGLEYHDKLVARKVNNFITKTKINLDEIKWASKREIEKLISKLKNKKAPGFDEIFSAMVKNLPNILIVNIVNGMLRLGYFPNEWKMAKIICIPKINKNPALVSSYRPVSLLPHWSKIAEKVLKSRILSFANSKKLKKSRSYTVLI